MLVLGMGFIIRENIKENVSYLKAVLLSIPGEIKKTPEYFGKLTTKYKKYVFKQNLQELKNSIRRSLKESSQLVVDGGFGVVPLMPNPVSDPVPTTVTKSCSWFPSWTRRASAAEETSNNNDREEERVSAKQVENKSSKNVLCVEENSYSDEEDEDIEIVRESEISNGDDHIITNKSYDDALKQIDSAALLELKKMSLISSLLMLIISIAVGLSQDPCDFTVGDCYYSPHQYA